MYLLVFWSCLTLLPQTKIPREESGELSVPPVSEGRGPGPAAVPGPSRHSPGRGGTAAGALGHGQISRHED